MKIFSALCSAEMLLWTFIVLDCWFLKVFVERIKLIMPSLMTCPACFSIKTNDINLEDIDVDFYMLIHILFFARLIFFVILWYIYSERQLSIVHLISTYDQHVRLGPSTEEERFGGDWNETVEGCSAPYQT